nr:DcaP family trimeric outer membrane transporter [Elizabethkingia sp. ASV34]
MRRKSLFLILESGISLLPLLYGQQYLHKDNILGKNGIKNKEWEVKLGGFIQADYMYDTQQMQSKDGFSSPSISLAQNNLKSSYFSVRQSRLRVDIKNIRSTISGIVEIDFFGNNNKTIPRLRQAYVRWGDFMFGQSWSNFSDTDSWGEIFDSTGPNSTMFIRQIQLRYTTKITSKSILSISLEDPNAPSITLPKDSVSWQKKVLLPSLVASYRYGKAKNYIRLAGILSPISYEKSLPDQSNTSKTILGIGLNLSGAYYFNNLCNLKFQTSYGWGYSTNNITLSKMGYDALPNSSKENILTPLSIFNTMILYEHWWSDYWSSVFYLSYSKIMKQSFIPLSNINNFQNTGVNIIYHPFSTFRIGLECTYGRIENFKNTSAQAIRYQLSTSFKF